MAGYWTLSTGYRWKIKDIMSFRGQALYAGIRPSVGRPVDSGTILACGIFR